MTDDQSPQTPQPATLQTDQPVAEPLATSPPQPLVTVETVLPATPEFAYTERQLATLEKAISTERLTPYYAQARGDQWVAIHLYERNTRLSEALYGVLQGLEVLLRNSIHRNMTKHLGAEDWYEKAPFLESEREEIERAKSTISDRPAKVIPGRVIAELNFGFWVRMFSGQYEKDFWVKSLHSVYPISMKRTTLHDRLTQIKTLRNRIAHHETLIKRDVRKDYADILEAIRWISPTVRTWVESTNSFEARCAERLPKKPKQELPQEPPKAE